MRNCDESDIICKDNSEKRYEEESRRRVDDKSAVINLQVDYLKEMIESIKREKIRELHLNELLLNEKEDIINTSVKSGYKRTSKYNMAGPSNTKGSNYDVTGLSNIKKGFSCNDNLSNKYSH
ncbi:14420_t:CDS:2 [Funneliformis caledonium]|uniref:14420_t:CDS:1 n=1 Tax=Funneliformis caledonium TaxID=1117310 RepID=A0A9N8YZC5_9GLOM|nr:14420_t:CDS:2 [Funneliformis caledonium]